MTRASLNAAYLLLTGAVLVGIALFFSVFQPLLADINQLQDHASQLQVTIAQKTDFARTIDQKKVELDGEAAQEQALAVALPETDAMEDVTRLLSRITTKTGGTITHLTNESDRIQHDLLAAQARGDKTVLPASIVPLAVTLEFDGSYEQLRGFLTEVSHAVRLMDVQTITINRVDQQPDQIKASISVELYRYGTHP